tara:strand:- start:601 stop:1281 length:681 start_codon:yes stop_codon:yes gene_type:complete
MLLLDGKRLVYGRAFSSNGVSYPANWLALTSREDHEAIGIIYADDPAPQRAWDQRWAWGYLDNGDLNWKNFDYKKDQLLSTNNQIAGQLLAPTDYTVTRKYEKGIDIPADVTSYRDEVRRINDAREAAIEATSTTEELYGISGFADLPYPSSVAEWKATREAAAAAESSESTEPVVTFGESSSETTSEASAATTSETSGATSSAFSTETSAEFSTETSAESSEATE